MRGGAVLGRRERRRRAARRGARRRRRAGGARLVELVRESGQKLDEVRQVAVHHAPVALGERGDARQHARHARVRGLRVGGSGSARRAGDGGGDVLGAQLVQPVLQQLRLGRGHASFARRRARRRRRVHGARERVGQRLVRRLGAAVEAQLEHLRELRRVPGDETLGVGVERHVEHRQTRSQGVGGVAARRRRRREKLLDERELDVRRGPRRERLAEQREGPRVQREHLLVLALAGQKRHAHQEVDHDLAHPRRRREVVCVGRRLHLRRRASVRGVLVVGVAHVDVVRVAHRHVLVLLRGGGHDGVLLLLVVLVLLLVLLLLLGGAATGTTALGRGFLLLLGFLVGGARVAARPLGTDASLRLLGVVVVVLLLLLLLLLVRLVLLAPLFFFFREGDAPRARLLPPQHELDQIDGERAVLGGRGRRQP